MRTRAYRFSGGDPAFPAQWLYGLLRALPGDRAFLPPSLPRKLSAELSASVGAPGPHDFAVRSNAIRPAYQCLTRPRPSHPASNVRDDRDTPLLWERDNGALDLIWGKGKAKYLLRAGWTGQIALMLRANFALKKHALQR
jgi:hypothetical protein